MCNRYPITEAMSPHSLRRLLDVAERMERQRKAKTCAIRTIASAAGKEAGK